MPTVVTVAAPRSVSLVEEEDGPVGPGEARIRTLYSGISAGTELSTYRGTSPHLTKAWDADARLFRDGGGDEPAYPVRNLGYEEVGEVVEVGSADAGVAVGDIVWGTWGHRTAAVLPAASVAARRLGPEADPRIGMFSHIGAVALNAVLDAEIRVGDTVAVFGLGVPGQLVAQLARLNGGEVIAVDGIPARRRLAADLGAAVTLDPADSPAERIRELTAGRGADVAIEISGSYAALHEAIRSVAYNSRVCAAGFYQGPGEGLRLGEEFHHNRVQVISSQISGVAPGLGHRWDRYRLNTTVLRLAADNRLRVLPLISHQLPYTEAAEAFRMLDADPHQVLQLVLDFREAP
ncbi:zinc-binding alcohol dehydrogenase [Naasia sp. SYSU D00948]|uniref:zinc-dependent alcohol dehydrogenase n=1 Tax=Naasia sp. SYSU D00948 TaxID=2817379 RepID=UPI001B314E7B|nr:zinc-binding alcohol dehydrogenase [Naasia sp. SYSU D00948]